MPKIRAQIPSVAFAAVILCLSTSSAFAYLDPGTGSIILQVLLGGIAGLAVALKLYWHQLLSWMGIRRPLEDGKPVSAGRNAADDQS
jgi:hypothetical protein